MHMFGYSIFYLFGIFLAFVLDKFIHGSVLWKIELFLKLVNSLKISKEKAIGFF
jgi:hypothetical protein